MKPARSRELAARAIERLGIGIQAASFVAGALAGYNSKDRKKIIQSIHSQACTLHIQMVVGRECHSSASLVRADGKVLQLACGDARTRQAALEVAE